MEPGLIFVFVIPLVAAVILAIWFFNGSLDRNRITAYIESRRWQGHRHHLGPVRPRLVRRQQGTHLRGPLHRSRRQHPSSLRPNQHVDWGVYFTEDRVVHYETPPIDKEEVESLEEENARLLRRAGTVQTQRAG